MKKALLLAFVTLILTVAALHALTSTEAAPRLKAAGAILAQGRVVVLNTEGAVTGDFYAEEISFSPNCEAAMMRAGENWFYWDFEAPQAVVVNPQVRGSQYEISWAVGNNGAPDWVTGRQWPWMLSAASTGYGPNIHGNESVYRGSAVEIITCGLR